MNTAGAVAVVFAVAVAAAFLAVVVGLVVHGSHDPQLATAAGSTGAAMLAVIYVVTRRNGNGRHP